jgi:hypothetical protein
MHLNNNNHNYIDYVNNTTFTSLNHRSLSNAQSPIVQMERVKTTDSLQDETKWHYVGNREDFYSTSSSDQAHEKGYSAEEKALVRRIDLLAMPIICMLDFLQVSIGSAL